MNLSEINDYYKNYKGFIQLNKSQNHHIFFNKKDKIGICDLNQNCKKFELELNNNHAIENFNGDVVIIKNNDVVIIKNNDVKDEFKYDVYTSIMYLLIIIFIIYMIRK